MAEDLRLWLDDEPIHARSISPSERLLRWCRRNPALAAMSAAAALLLLLVAVVASIGYQRTSYALQTAETERSRAEQALEEEANARREAAYQSYCRGVPLAYQKWLGGDVRQTKMILDRCPLEFRLLCG